MRRADFLQLTGLSVASYRGMVVNDQLPWIDVAEGWTDYTPLQAFETCLTIALAPHVGGLGEAAKRVVELPSNLLLTTWPFITDETEADGWAACITPNLPADDPRPLKRPFGWVIAPLAKILERPTSLGPSVVDYASALTSVPLVNLSEIVRAMEARARAAGVQFSRSLAVDL